MKVISTNIGEPKTVLWKGKEIKTGIYKYPIDSPIYLGKEDVQNDHVIDRRYHGGVDKACYLYAADHYAYWKIKYPDLEWNYGMFGENITVEGFDEKNIKIGSLYRLGNAIIQISRTRQPCFKLGIRFGDQTMVKNFIDSFKSGVYVRVVESGKVSVGDTFVLENENHDGITVTELNILRFHYNEKEHGDLIKKALFDLSITEEDKKYFRKKV
ncbi:MOSC domain-containing protein [Aquimarina muelleri]|uniref:Molybdenum cofactor biosysynthesis protein n=1 Tax=Aquimarina muelleri TaxID=279356 RepID=A0A918JYC8_9FLAO|nr:MOSC domain-containing protein [Aquimarina muelleri]MCX2764776.1 MOSC domain-containing protein [Aquimarina muelleri]GGX33629.1 molybdenum cofactor biosysynthesis protein [Aquimarina muelleri]